MSEIIEAAATVYLAEWMFSCIIAACALVVVIVCGIILAVRKRRK